MTKQILECLNCDNRFYEFDSDKICMYCDTLDQEDVEILLPSELNECDCKQCKQMQEVAA